MTYFPQKTSLERTGLEWLKTRELRPLLCAGLGREFRHCNYLNECLMPIFPLSRPKKASALLLLIAAAGAGAYGVLRAGTPPQSSQLALPEVDVAVVLQQNITDL